VLVAVRGFLSFAVVNKEAPQWVLGAIYELADTRDLPLEAQSEDGGLFYRMRARHHLQEPETAVDRASDKEIVALFAACRSARDRLIVLLLSHVGLRRRDLHLLPDNRSLGCGVHGAHVHVIRRDNINGAWAKSRHTRAVPMDFLVVMAVDQYLLERQQCPAAARSDYVLSGYPDNTYCLAPDVIRRARQIRWGSRVTAPVLGFRRQFDQRGDRPLGAQRRVGQHEQRVRPRGQTPVFRLSQVGMITPRASSTINRVPHRAPRPRNSS
jgi:hypothetical protein